MTKNEPNRPPFRVDAKLKKVAQAAGRVFEDEEKALRHPHLKLKVLDDEISVNKMLAFSVEYEGCSWSVGSIIIPPLGLSTQEVKKIAQERMTLYPALHQPTDDQVRWFLTQIIRDMESIFKVIIP